jgi:Mor family transcriptional regulator
MSLLDTITADDLDGEQREIAELIGIENYRKLVTHFGGTSIYIFQAESIVKDKRDNEIRKQYNGYNSRELAIRYNLSDRTIREITASMKRIEGQQSFF